MISRRASKSALKGVPGEAVNFWWLARRVEARVRLIRRIRWR